MVPQLKKIMPPQEYVAGRLKYFVENWKIITSDKSVLETVQGYHIPLISKPHQWRKRITKTRSIEQKTLLSQAIVDLVAIGAVKQTMNQDDQFLSTLFIIKQSNKVRPIFNLKALNNYVQTEKFKLESLDLVKTMLKPDDYLMKLDLKNAYYSVPIAEDHKKYLRFQFQEVTYEYQCLPFGLSSAPRAFTKLLKPVIAILRSSGIRVVIYLDDLLILHHNPAELRKIFQLVTTLLTNLGFIINLEKCSPSPTQAIVFLGASLDSKKMTIAVPHDKLHSLQTECRDIQKRQGCSMVELSALLGRMNQTARIGIWKAPLYYRALQRLYIAALHKNGRFTRSKHFQIPLTQQASKELEWWSSNQLTQHNQMTLTLPPFDMIISTDASKRGWGASFMEQKTGGQWTKQEARAHINVLELKAAYLAIQAVVKNTSSHPRHIQLLMDNTTAVAYINKRGGTRSPSLASLALEIWTFCLSHQTWVTARHVAGVTNIEADFASRNFNNRTEWTLDKKVFRKITKRFYAPEVDLFASRINNQLPLYVARYPDPGSIATDAFLQNWNQWTVFIHAPIVLLPKILQKIRQDQATGLVIAPTWSGQPWYPTLLELLVDFPAPLPITEGTISLPFDPQAIHPMWKTLRLAVWPLSGLVYKQQAFHQKCVRSCWPLGEQAHRRDMKHLGSCGLAGAFNGINVHFQHL